MYHSTLGSRVIKKKKTTAQESDRTNKCVVLMVKCDTSRADIVLNFFFFFVTLKPRVE